MDGCADNPVAQKLLVRQLQRYNLNVIATSNGEEAIAGSVLLLKGPHQSHNTIFRMGRARPWLFQPRDVRPPYAFSHVTFHWSDTTYKTCQSVME